MTFRVICHASTKSVSGVRRRRDNLINVCTSRFHKRILQSMEIDVYFSSKSAIGLNDEQAVVIACQENYPAVG